MIWWVDRRHPSPAPCPQSAFVRVRACAFGCGRGAGVWRVIKRGNQSPSSGVIKSTSRSRFSGPFLICNNTRSPPCPGSWFPTPHNLSTKGELTSAFLFNDLELLRGRLRGFQSLSSSWQSFLESSLRTTTLGPKPSELLLSPFFLPSSHRTAVGSSG